MVQLMYELQPRHGRMNPLFKWLEAPHGPFCRPWLTAICVVVLAVSGAGAIKAQDDPLDKVHVPPPTAVRRQPARPQVLDAPAATGAGRPKPPGSLIR